MPLYTADTARSTDVPCAVELADRISETQAYKDLTGTTSDAAALATIVVGPGEPPWDGEAFTETEIRQRHCWANIFAPGDGGSGAFLGTGVNELNESGTCQVELTWSPTEADLAADNGAQDCYRFFWDRITALKPEIWEAVYGSEFQCPRVQSIDLQGFGWTSDEREAAEGACLGASFLVSWGDLEQ